MALNILKGWYAIESNSPASLLIELIDLEWWEDSKSKILACYICDFYKNHVFPSRWFLNFSHHTQQIVSTFGTTYCCELLFSKMKCVKSMLHSQLLNHYSSDILFLSTFSFNSDNIYLWLQTSDIAIINYNSYLVNFVFWIIRNLKKIYFIFFLFEKKKLMFHFFYFILFFKIMALSPPWVWLCGPQTE